MNLIVFIFEIHKEANRGLTQSVILFSADYYTIQLGGEGYCGQGAPPAYSAYAAPGSGGGSASANAPSTKRKSLQALAKRTSSEPHDDAKPGNGKGESKKNGRGAV